MIPSKTFFLGEYLALKGGPALLGLTHPSFTVDERKRLHPESTAARFFFKNTGTTCDWGLNDPYQGKGGFGASSAEFLIAYRKIFGDFNNLEHLHQHYLQCVTQKTAQQPSGYDLLAQTAFGCTVVEISPIRLTSWCWPFEEIGFFLIHTGQKLKTHQHLAKKIEIPHWQRMMSATEIAIQGIEFSEVDRLLEGIQSFAQCLLQSGFVAPHTDEMLKKINELPILAAKGCGAMGADIILVIAAKEQKCNLLEKFQSLGYDLIATDQDMFVENAKK